MNRLDYNNVDEFLRNINLKDFPLLEYYLGYDDCYTDNEWIQYSIYYNDLNVPIGIIAKRLPKQQIEHILLLEVSKPLRHLGFGKKIIKDYMGDYPYWELFSVENAEGFYKKLGFKKDRYSEMFMYGLE